MSGVPISCSNFDVASKSPVVLTKNNPANPKRMILAAFYKRITVTVFNFARRTHPIKKSDKLGNAFKKDHFFF